MRRVGCGVTFSICICTRDRPRLLQQALSSLASLDQPNSAWETLVVDNGSQPALSPSIADSYPALDLRVVAEPQAGLSRARNTAIEHAHGEGLIFIDDDVTVPKSWLKAYEHGFEQYPEAAFFGGPIRACMDDPASEGRLRALEAVMPGAVGLLNPQLPEGRLPRDSQVLPWGANVAFRRSALGARQFDLERGRRPAAPLGSGEETELIHALLGAGLHGVWLPLAKLNHHVGSERCTSRYLKEYTRGIGWLEGRRTALETNETAENWLRWAIRQRRSKRWARWATPPWAPLTDRWAVLREQSVIEGLIEGFEHGLMERERYSKR